MILNFSNMNDAYVEGADQENSLFHLEKQKHSAGGLSGLHF